MIGDSEDMVPLPLPTQRPRRNTRPRDALGRPMPYGTDGAVPGQPAMAGFDPDAALEEAQRLLDAGLPFHAHEVLEDTWKAAPPDQRALWKSLAQLAVGITHARRGNVAGALALIRRGAEGLPPGGAPNGVDTAEVKAWARRAVSGLAEGGARNDLPPLRLRPPAQPSW
ncbi:MAG: hypothetical protein JWN61_1473 [Pseudonocardiales bacterium]|nr:hypothetical protein [Jatrophihabitantaceae bacterium]MCW2603338.1 hypothetical protein [Pseudonocardiales bacterium]